MSGPWLFSLLAGTGVALKYVFEASEQTMLIFYGFVCFAILAFWQERYHKIQIEALQKIIDRLDARQD